MLFKSKTCKIQPSQTPKIHPIKDEISHGREAVGRGGLEHKPQGSSGFKYFARRLVHSKHSIKVSWCSVDDDDDDDDNSR